MSDGFDWGSIDWSSTYGGLTEEDAAAIREANESQDLGGMMTALDSFSTGRIEDTSGTRAIARDPDTGEQVLVTTNEDDPDTTWWGAPVRHQETIPGGVEASPGLTAELANLEEITTEAVDSIIPDAPDLAWLSWFKWVALIAVLLYLAKPGLEIGANLTE